MATRYTHAHRDRFRRRLQHLTFAAFIAVLVAVALLLPWHPDARGVPVAAGTFTGKLYGKVFTSLWNKEIDFDTDTINVGATTSTYTVDQDAHDYLNDITNEVSGGGYARVALSSKTVTYTGATNKHVLDAADTDFATATFTARLWFIYDASPGSDATRPLIGYEQNDADITGGGGTLTIVWNASGIVEITVG